MEIYIVELVVRCCCCFSLLCITSTLKRIQSVFFQHSFDILTDKFTFRFSHLKQCTMFLDSIEFWREKKKERHQAIFAFGYISIWCFSWYHMGLTHTHFRLITSVVCALRYAKTDNLFLGVREIHD